MEESILETRDLTKRFGGLLVLDHVSINVPKGQLRCIIGPNGAGKTTLFNHISGHLSPDSGKIIFAGHDITGLPVYKIARMGIIRKFQVPSMYDELTVGQNILISVMQNDGSKSSLGSWLSAPSSQEKEKAIELMKRVKLEAKADQQAKHLSHGEKQWLEIAITLGCEPKLLLLDEPTAGMTLIEADTTAALVRSLLDSTSVIVVEHDIRVVKQIADYITVLDEGMVLAEGTVQEITENKKVVEAYLGRQNSLVKNREA